MKLFLLVVLSVSGVAATGCRCVSQEKVDELQQRMDETVEQVESVKAAAKLASENSWELTRQALGLRYRDYLVRLREDSDAKRIHAEELYFVALREAKAAIARSQFAERRLQLAYWEIERWKRHVKEREIERWKRHFKELRAGD